MQLGTAFVPETQIYSEMRKHCGARRCSSDVFAISFYRLEWYEVGSGRCWGL